MKANVIKFKLSYSFFQEKVKDDILFTLAELAEKTGWSGSTVRTYLDKKQ